MGWYKPGLWTRLDWIFCESGHGLQLKFCFGTGALGLYTQWSSEYTMPASKYTWKNSPWSGHLPAYAMRGLPAGHVTHVDLPVVYKNSINLIAMWSTLSLCFEKQAWQDSSGSDSFGEVTSVKHLITSFLVYCHKWSSTHSDAHIQSYNVPLNIVSKAYFSLHSVSLLSTNYSITSGFACACESTGLFKALKIAHESSSTKLILCMLERQQLQIYLVVFLVAKYILCLTVCVDNQHTG